MLAKFTLFCICLSVLVSGTPPLSAGVLPQDGDARYELAFWESIKNSNHAEDYEAYLQSYPEGRFAPLAKARASYLSNKKASTSNATTQSEEPIIIDLNADFEVINTADLLKQPNVQSPALNTLKKGRRIKVIGRVKDQNWYLISVGQGITGFVSGSLVKEYVPRPAIPKPEVQAKPQEQKPPATPKQPPASKTKAKPGEFQDCPECPVMVSLPAGTFTMGDNKGESAEKPEHSVTIRKPFAIGKYEVTVNQWHVCVEAEGCEKLSDKSGDDPNQPVRDLSWEDALKYVKWLSEKTGATYRLPTETEWEYAARGGTRSRFWWGGKFTSGKANCKDCGGQWDRKAPSTVGSHAPNPFGLHDMNGSVWEWVSDCWHSSYRGAPKDETAWDKKDCRKKVIRGGSWRNDKSYMHSANRFNYDLYVRYLVNGFRVAKTLK